MINRDSRGHSYSDDRGEILGPSEDELLRKHLPRVFSCRSPTDCCRPRTGVSGRLGRFPFDSTDQSRVVWFRTRGLGSTVPLFAACGLPTREILVKFQTSSQGGRWVF